MHYKAMASSNEDIKQIIWNPTKFTRLIDFISSQLTTYHHHICTYSITSVFKPHHNGSEIIFAWVARTNPTDSDHFL